MPANARSKKRKSRRKQQRNQRIAQLVLLASAAVLLIALVALCIQFVASLPGSHRMEDFADEPPEIYEDLLYLSYLDSLYHDDLAVPSVPTERDSSRVSSTATRANSYTARSAKRRGLPTSAPSSPGTTWTRSSEIICWSGGGSTEVGGRARRRIRQVACG